MKIVLYKNYPFNDDYNQVIHYTKIDSYLATLPKLELNYLNIFFRNGDTIIFDETLLYENINNFNYLVIENTDTGFKFYCFIEDITHNNDNCELTYKIDYWNTYSNKLSINFGTISQNLRLSENFNVKYPYKLPIELYSNKKINLVKFDNNQTNNFYVLAKVQIYTLGQSGEVTNRTQKIIKIKRTGYDYISRQGVFNIINLLAINSQLYTFTLNNVVYNLEIVNFYIIPTTEITIYDDSVNITIGNSIFSFLPQFADSTEHLSIEENSKTFVISFVDDNDFKKIGIGHLNNMIPIKMTGQSITGEICYIVTYTGDIVFYLSVNNSIYDITSDYYYELPIDLASKESLQLQRLNRKLENRNIEITNTQAGIEGVLGFASGLTGTLVGAVTDNYIGIAQGVEKSISSEVEALSVYEKLKLKSEKINANLFASSQSIKLQQNIGYLMKYGMCTFVGDFNNFDDVIKIKSQFGYTTNKIVGTEIYQNTDKEYDVINKPTIQNKSEYDYIKFDNIDLKANLPQHVLRQFVSILVNGIKIYYNTNNL